MFSGWDNYFFLTGSAAAGLTGLLFVVVTLTAGRERSSAMRGVALYMTPTMVHFAVVLTISALVVAPKLPAGWTAGLTALATIVGLLNALRACVGIAMPRRGLSAPHWSDLWCYGVAPVLLYLVMAAACVQVWRQAEGASAMLAALMLALLLLGIRNAWDLVTWIAPGDPALPAQASAPPPQSPAS